MLEFLGNRSTNRYGMGILVALFVATASVTGCGGKATPAERTYPIKGRVVAVGTDRVTLDHEAIPGYMGAMQMEFPVAKPELLTDLKAGDQVQGRLNASGSQPTIDELKKN